MADGGEVDPRLTRAADSALPTTRSGSARLSCLFMRWPARPPARWPTRVLDPVKWGPKVVQAAGTVPFGKGNRRPKTVDDWEELRRTWRGNWKTSHGSSAPAGWISRPGARLQTLRAARLLPQEGSSSSGGEGGNVTCGRWTRQPRDPARARTSRRIPFSSRRLGRDRERRSFSPSAGFCGLPRGGGRTRAKSSPPDLLFTRSKAASEMRRRVLDRSLAEAAEGSDPGEKETRRRGDWHAPEAHPPVRSMRMGTSRQSLPVAHHHHRLFFALSRGAASLLSRAEAVPA